MGVLNEKMCKNFIIHKARLRDRLCIFRLSLLQQLKRRRKSKTINFDFTFLYFFSVNIAVLNVQNVVLKFRSMLLKQTTLCL